MVSLYHLQAIKEPVFTWFVIGMLRDLKHVNWWYMTFIATMVASFFSGLIFVWLAGQVSHLACLRQPNGQFDCQFEKQYFGLFVISQQAVSQVSEAIVREDCRDECVYWVELQTVNGVVRLTRFSSFNRAGVTADQHEINQYLNDGALNRFYFVGRPSWLLLLSGIFFTGLGGAFLGNIIKLYLNNKKTPGA